MAQGGAINSNKSSQQTSKDQAKIPPKENQTTHHISGQIRKRRLVPVKALPIEGMREAAQLARNYIRAIETHNQVNQGRSMANLYTSSGITFPYEHLLHFSRSMVNAQARLLPQDLALFNQLHSNGIIPGHLINIKPPDMAINKRPFYTNTAEESRLKRLRKIITSTTLKTLENQSDIHKYRDTHNNSPLLPSPPTPISFFDSKHKDPSFHYPQKSPSIQYSSDPPSPTPRKASLTHDMRLDSSAFLSRDEFDATTDGFYDAKDNQMRKPIHAPLSQQHISAKGSIANALLQVPSNNLSFSQLDGICHISSHHSQNSSTLDSFGFDNRPQMMPVFINSEQKSQMICDGVHLSQVGQEVPIGLPHFSRPELAAYLGHLAISRNTPQHESGMHFSSGQHQDIINHPHLPNNPSVGILPIPLRPKLNESSNNLNSLSYLPPDAGILPLPGRSELVQLASLQQGFNDAQGFSDNQHSIGQPVYLSSLPTHGNLASLQQEFSGQRSAVAIRNQPFFSSPQVQNQLQYLNQELSTQRLMGTRHPLLPSLVYPNDLTTFPQELSAQHFISATGHQQGDLNAFQQELSAQRLQNSLLHPSSLPHDLSSLQQELLSHRLNADHHQFLQSFPMKENSPLLQQELAAHGLNGHRSLF